MDSIPMATPVETSMATSVATPVKIDEDETIEKRQGEFSVQLDKKGDYSNYPYMDSFKYYDPSKGILYNSSNFDYEYELTDTEGGNGSCSECGGSGRVECGDCDGDGTRECDECDGNGSVSIRSKRASACFR